MKMIRMAVLVAAASAAASKAKDYARENPEKASQAIGTVESFLAGKAGPKYADKVGKGSDALRTSLGLSARTTTPPSSASPVVTGSSSSDQGNGFEPKDPPRGFDPSI